MEVILSHYSKDLALDAFNHYILGNVKSTYDAHSALLHYVSAVREYACSLCFHFNLERAARKAEELGLDEFTTTLTVSRFKNSKKSDYIGENMKGQMETYNQRLKNIENQKKELDKFNIQNNELAKISFHYRW